MNGDLHNALEDAYDRYPDHSLAVILSGRNPDGGMDGMMFHPVPFPAYAASPTVAGLVAPRRGDYTLSYLTNCEYGHSYMDLDGTLAVQ